MSLREAVIAIADAMDQEAIRYGDGANPVAPLFRAYAQQLKVALKASEGEVQRISAKDVGIMPDLFGFAAKEAKEQADRVRREASSDTSLSPFEVAEIATALDPGMIGDMIPVGGVTVNAYVPLGGSVYQLRGDGKLYHSEQKTKEWCEARAQQQG